MTLVVGRTAKADLTTPFLFPGEGLLTATVTVTGAPAGFDDQVAVTACPTDTTDQCQTFYPDEIIDGTVPPDEIDSVTVLLTAGSWTVSGMYLADPFDNAVPGPSQKVKVTGGDTATVALTVPYQVPGTAAGSIVVTGIRPTPRSSTTRCWPVPLPHRMTGSRSPPSAPVSIRALPVPGPAAVSS